MYKLTVAPMVLLCTAFPSRAQEPTPQAATAQPVARVQRPITTEQISPNVYWVHNVGFAAYIVGDKGVIAIDTGGSTEAGKKIVENIAKVTPEPVNALIFSHEDADHVDGTAAFPAGIPVYAQAECRLRLEKVAASGETGPEIPKIAPEHMPNHSVGNKEDLTIDGVKLQLLHWGPAHTSGDLVVYLPQEKLALVSDVLVMDQNDLPLIHMDKGGTSRGWIETVRALLALPAEKYVVGHEGLVGKSALQRQLDATIAERTDIKQLYDRGVSLENIQTAVNDPLPSTKGKPRHFPPFSEVVYTELKNKTY